MSEGRVAVMNDAARDGELDLSAVGRALIRKKWWVLGPALAVAALTFVGVNLITPKYKSEVRLIIEGRENVFLRPEAEKAAERDRTIDQEAVTSQVQLAMSRDVARQVIKQLKLGELPEFDSTLRGVSLIRYSLGFLGIAKDPLSMTPEERVLEAYFERLSVFPIDKSRVITIEFHSAAPDLAARVANAIADNYLSVQQAARFDQHRAAPRRLGGAVDVSRPPAAGLVARSMCSARVSPRRKPRSRTFDQRRTFSLGATARCRARRWVSRIAISRPHAHRRPNWNRRRATSAN